MQPSGTDVPGPTSEEADVQRAKRAVALGGAVLASVVLIQGSVASADPTSGSGDGREHTVRFDVQFSPFQLTDLGEPGPSAGDEIVFHDTLSQHGKQVGDEVGSCVVVDPAGLSNCTGIVRLGEDTISFAFVNAPPPLKVLAVTGGSGAYRTVRGDGVLLENGDAANTGTLTLRLTR